MSPRISYEDASLGKAISDIFICSKSICEPRERTPLSCDEELFSGPLVLSAAASGVRLDVDKDNGRETGRGGEAAHNHYAFFFNYTRLRDMYRDE